MLFDSLGTHRWSDFFDWIQQNPETAKMAWLAIELSENRQEQPDMRLQRWLEGSARRLSQEFKEDHSNWFDELERNPRKRRKANGNHQNWVEMKVKDRYADEPRNSKSTNNQKISVWGIWFQWRGILLCLMRGYESVTLYPNIRTKVEESRIAEAFSTNRNDSRVPFFTASKLIINLFDFPRIEGKLFGWRPYAISKKEKKLERKTNSKLDILPRG